MTTLYNSAIPLMLQTSWVHLLNYHLEGHRELVEFDIYMGHQLCCDVIFTCIHYIGPKVDVQS